MAQAGRRVVGTGIAAVALLVAGAGQAAADKPFRVHLEGPIPFQCHGVDGVIHGTAEVLVHLHENPEGEEIAIARLKQQDAYFTTETGETYRVRGVSLEKSFTAPPEGPAGDDFFFRNANFVVVGDGGRLGMMRERMRQGGAPEVDGGCDYVGDVPGRP